MFSPLGAVSEGLDSPEKMTSVGHPVAAKICIGPVSFPTEIFAFLPKEAIWLIDVLSLRLIILSEILEIFLATSSSFFVWVWSSTERALRSGK